MLKICIKCNLEKTEDEFKNNLKKCKLCWSEHYRIWRNNNKVLINQYRENHHNKIKKQRERWYAENKEIILTKLRESRKNDPEKWVKYNKTYRIKNKEKINLNQKNRRKNNRERENKYCFTYRNNDPLNKLSHNLRCRIRHFLKNRKMLKSNKTFDIIGCDKEFLRNYIEKQFSDGMSWENYGYYGWHVDHKIPLNNGITENEIIKLCHYTNLQPMWWHDNLCKGKRI